MIIPYMFEKDNFFAAVAGCGMIGYGNTKEKAIEQLDKNPIYVNQALSEMMKDWNFIGDKKPFFLS
jgi:hypothetical protein